MAALAYRPVPEASSAWLQPRGSIVGVPDIEELGRYTGRVLRVELPLLMLFPVLVIGAAAVFAVMHLLTPQSGIHAA
jgi:hypothetical protein